MDEHEYKAKEPDKSKILNQLLKQANKLNAAITIGSRFKTNTTNCIEALKDVNKTIAEIAKTLTS